MSISSVIYMYLINSLHAEYFSVIFRCLLIFLSKSTLLKNSFRLTIRGSNSLDEDQARHYVGPDLGPDCLQRLSPDNKSRCYNRQRVNIKIIK